MRKVKLTPPPLILKAGTFIEEKYSNYKEMLQSSTSNWEFNCTYELLPKALTGLHQTIQLETMFVSLVTRPGGMMHDALSAKDTISLLVHIELEDKACCDKLKINQGDIVIVDDRKAYNYLTNASVSLGIVTIANSRLGDMYPFFLGKAMYKLRDTDGELGRLSRKIWKEFTASSPSENFKVAEEEILSVIRKIVQRQIPIAPKLTKAEEVAYAIREQVYHHMDGNIKIEEFVKKYKISERSLQSGFKSLFGFTPKIFIRNLKLNLIRHDLSFVTKNETTIIMIAHKWGFFHMGRFSKYYKELFEETPSETLKRSFDKDKAFSGGCVQRKEEIY